MLSKAPINLFKGITLIAVMIPFWRLKVSCCIVPTCGIGSCGRTARLFSTLNAIQSKLLHLESENAISRRRVHELELELKACKVEVKRERTRVSVEDVIAQQRQLADTNAPRRSKSMVHEGDQSRTERYNEVVEEKTGMEITTMALPLLTTIRENSPGGANCHTSRSPNTAYCGTVITAAALD